MASRKIKQKPYKERVEDLIKKETALFEKAGMHKLTVIHYPHKKKAPLVGKFAEWLLRVTGAHVGYKYLDIKK